MAWYKKLNYLWRHYDKNLYFNSTLGKKFTWIWLHQGQAPGGLHYNMFLESMECFSSDEQRKKWMDKVRNF